MSIYDKQRQRLLTRPKDFTFDEVRSLLKHLGYEEDCKGKTSGSRVAFIRKSDFAVVRMHKPHPSNIVKQYAIDELIDTLKNNGDLQ